jgi:hypothetical protein
MINALLLITSTSAVRMHGILDLAAEKFKSEEETTIDLQAES